MHLCPGEMWGLTSGRDGGRAARSVAACAEGAAGGDKSVHFPGPSCERWGGGESLSPRGVKALSLHGSYPGSEILSARISKFDYSLICFPMKSREPE